MGVFDWLFGRTPSTSIPFDTHDAAQRVLPEPYEPFRGGAAGIPVVDPGVPMSWGYRGEVERIWRSQPNVRKVVGFIARNVASIPLHTHERVSDNDRQRVKDHPLDDLMSTPQPRLASSRFWNSVLSDGLLYDQWAAMFVPAGDDGVPQLVQIPSWRLWLDVDALRRVTAAWFWVGDQQQSARRDTHDGWRQLDLDTLIYDYGYAPSSAGMSPMVTLSNVLAESAEAIEYRRQVWANGARVPTYISRPATAPHWSTEAQDRFAAMFKAAYTQDGPGAGGTPLLYDGMELKSTDAFTPQDAQDLEGRRLTSAEVASAFYVAPELIGAQQGNYSNLREYRQMLYRDSLGPYIESIEATLNAQLVPMLAGGRRLYVEANVESKLRGDFIEQAAVKQSATGAPWLTRNEARTLENRPPIDGGDELVVPLNVLTGHQASPRDSGSQNRGPKSKSVGPVAFKAVVPDAYDKRARKVLSDFFARQGRVVQSRVGAGDGDWWDEDRWDSELSDDVFRVAELISTYVGETTAESIGYEPSAYNVDQTLKYLRAVSDRIASQVNYTTREQITAALDDGDSDPVEAVSHVYEVAESSRAEQSAVTLGTTFGGFAAVEAAKQTGGTSTTKTWVVNSGNPRASHAAMSGETVAIGEAFSNGMDFPGSFEGGVDEVAGCQCSVQINRPD